MAAGHCRKITREVSPLPVGGVIVDPGGPSCSWAPSPLSSTPSAFRLCDSSPQCFAGSRVVPPAEDFAYLAEFSGAPCLTLQPPSDELSHPIPLSPERVTRGGTCSCSVTSSGGSPSAVPKKKVKKGKEREDLSLIFAHIHDWLGQDSTTPALLAPAPLVGPGCPGPASDVPSSSSSGLVPPSFLARDPAHSFPSFALVLSHPAALLPTSVGSSLSNSLAPPPAPQAGPSGPSSHSAAAAPVAPAQLPPLASVLDWIRALRHAPDPSTEHASYLHSIFNKAAGGVDLSDASQVANLLSILSQVAPGQDFGPFLALAFPVTAACGELLPLCPSFLFGL